MTITTHHQPRYWINQPDHRGTFAHGAYVDRPGRSPVDIWSDEADRITVDNVGDWFDFPMEHGDHIVDCSTSDHSADLIAGVHFCWGCGDPADVGLNSGVHDDVDGLCGACSAIAADVQREEAMAARFER